MDLFELSQSQTDRVPVDRPLAERMRPQQLEEFFGQQAFASPQGALLRGIRERGHFPNLILWGPPGTGKTTFAHLLAQLTDRHFETANAVDTGAKKLRELGEAARVRRLQLGKGSVLFVDEIHRLNKAQQDVLLPYTERGDFALVGATTENPSYELNRALLSRCRVLTFERLAEEDLKKIGQRAVAESGKEWSALFTEKGEEALLRMANGDARKLLNILELVVKSGDDTPSLDEEGIAALLIGTTLYYDKAGDEHYDTISAFIKSIRGSDANAGVYYLARMLEAGEDPVFIARRLVILASEDIGNADPRGLTIAVSGLQAVELVGMPEAAINLSQVVTYLASAPKSNRSYEALNRARELVQKTGTLPIPKSLRSSQTELSRSLGHGRDYRYSHNGPKGYVAQTFLPEQIADEVLYEPSERGFEKTIREYLAWLKG